jgi:hypothetical protein
MIVDEPQNEAELLKHESQMARESLQQVRGEIFQSLSRTADVEAWTSRYPWPALGTAAVAGVTTGWGLGKMLWRSRRHSQNTAPQEPDADARAKQSSRGATAAASLVGGLGTLMGAMASAVAVAATEAVKDVVKEKVHETLNPELKPEPASEMPPQGNTSDEAI